MFKTINAWRGIFALVIVLYHSHVHWMDQAVSLGVSFFFVASGFLLTVRHRHDFDELNGGHWWRFWWQRACRIYPIHWLALACIVVMQVVLEHKIIDWSILSAEATLTQSWINQHRDFYFGYNGQSWFLSSLLFCYACYPLFARYFSRWRLRWQLLAVAVVMAVLAICLPQMTGSQRTYTYVCPAIRIGDFALGVVAANIYQKFSSHSRIRLPMATILELSAVALALTVVLINRHTRLVSVWDHYLVWWIPATVIVFVAGTLNGQEGRLGRFLLAKPFQWLGKVSLEIYLFQGVAAMIVNYTISPLLGHFGIMAYDQYVWSQVPLLLLMSWGIYKLRTKCTPLHTQRQ